MLALGGPLTACAGSAPTPAAPTWVPKPDAPYQAEPQLPGGSPTAGPPSSASPPGAGGSPGPGSTTAADPTVVAKNLTAPTGLALLPDGSALVGERTSGRILAVQPTPDQPTPVVQTLAALDTTDGGGLLDLAVSPNYAEDKLVYALVSTAVDLEVVTFTLGGPVTPVVTGLPKGSGRIAFDPTGQLLVAAGTTVTRFDDIGRPAPDNPASGSAVYSTGLSAPAGLCLAAAAPSGPAQATVLVASADQLAIAAPGGALSGPLAPLPTGRTGVSGCAVIGTRVYLSTLAGAAVVAADLTATGSFVTTTAFTVAVAGTYGRLRTVVAAPDGALWLTTSNLDGQGRPVAADERVVRIVPTGGGGTGSKA